jgi:hypothetical protein
MDTNNLIASIDHFGTKRYVFFLRYESIEKELFAGKKIKRKLRILIK